MKKSLLVILFLLIVYKLSAQQQFSIVRGKVVDAQTEQTLPGAVVQLTANGESFVVSSDAKGEFVFDKVPIGRVNINVDYVGYLSIKLENLSVFKGKDLDLLLKLDQSVVDLGQVTVVSQKNKLSTQNEMATVSSRSFTIEETERFAGSRGDPSRMAANYAGVIMNNDQRNDIIIRGNSPVGLLWRMDGIDIPNPNHYGSMGVSGGVLSMLNNNTLTNSDFFTSAFPAEYGNALGGVFDLQMRSGNNKRYQFLGQVGFNGFEIGAEGPISKKQGSSFLINARYSTMEVMSLMGMDFGTGAAVPHYMDLSFKVNFPRGKYGSLSLFGVGGKNSIAMLASENDSAQYGFAYSDLRYSNQMGTIGLNYKFYFNNHARLSIKLGASYIDQGTQLDSLLHNGKDTLYHFYWSKGKNPFYSISPEFFYKFSPKTSLKTGLSFRIFNFAMVDCVYIENKYISQFDVDKYYNYGQYFLQLQHRFTNYLTLNAGVFAHYLFLNKTYSIDPRIGLKWSFNEKSTINIGIGNHSQTQMSPFYYLKDSIGNYTNRNLEMNKSLHAVIGYDYFITKTFRVKAELYYQYLYNLPISSNYKQFCMINEGDEFTISGDHSMKNDGTGKNYGVELTLEKFLSQGFYFLFTSSLFRSTYVPFDGKEYNTKFNNGYVMNLLAGYEFKIGKFNVLAIDVKGAYAGGKRYTPIDIEKSKQEGYTVLIAEQSFTKQYPVYFRLNARITFRVNAKKAKLSQEWGLDLDNITNHQNVFTSQYDPFNNNIYTTYQMGFMPMMTYKIYF